MLPLKISFNNFWPGFDYNDNFICKALRNQYDITIVKPNESPDIHFYSLFGNLSEHYRYTDSIRIYYTTENDVPNFTECDYAISTHDLNLGRRHFRLPIYTHYNDSYSHLTKDEKKFIEDPLSRKFCCAVISNNTCADPIRDLFIKQLSKYKTVECGGRHNNNIGAPVKDKIDFCSKYKFCIAFENSRVPHYVTEKLPDALYAGCVPIYWGDPYADEQFNIGAFIDISKFNTIERAIEYIIAVDNDPDMYLNLLNSKPLSNTSMANWEVQFCDFISDALFHGKQMVDYGANQRLYRYNKLGAELRSYDFLCRNFDNFIKAHRVYEQMKERWNIIKTSISKHL